MTMSDLNTLAFVAYAVWVIGAVATLARTGALDAAFTWPLFWPCYAVWRLLRPKTQPKKARYWKHCECGWSLGYADKNSYLSARSVRCFFCKKPPETVPYASALPKNSTIFAALREIDS